MGSKLGPTLGTSLNIGAAPMRRDYAWCSPRPRVLALRRASTRPQEPEQHRSDKPRDRSTGLIATGARALINGVCAAAHRPGFIARRCRRAGWIGFAKPAAVPGSIPRLLSSPMGADASIVDPNTVT